MLSNDLDSLSRTLAQAVEKGLVSDALVTCAALLLRSRAEDARALEAVAMPARARITQADLPDNVIEIASILHRKGVRTGAQLPTGGDAA
ncbi:hypothetical protein [Telmatospirillum sp. J64-1]|uniref:hypothetical protein n=1 Tax=Telmatospirillum sp. J64-1 TaxID=2502183 RepID=UPI00115F75E9|nr:hypothetical protein [Telmatospirillum sp. J64-1]